MRINKKTKGQNKYAMFVVSLKSKFWKSRRKEISDYPNLHILVEKYDERLQKAIKTSSRKQQVKILGLKKRFRGIVQSDGICLFENKVDAYKAAYEKLGSMRIDKRKVRMYRDSDTKKYNVYCIRLTSNVWQDEKKFRKNNEHIDAMNFKIHAFVDAYYVGQTAQEIIERYKQHISLDPKESNSTNWGKKYFLKEFDEAFDHKLIQDFEKETGKSTADLPYGMSIIIEHELTDWIRKKGMGAYCA
jgi:hypothetical protein